MARGKKIPKRIIAPEAKYGDLLLARFINFVMESGKKTTAQRIVYGALDIVAEKTGEKQLEVFKKVIEIVKPQVEVRSRRVGGANYQVPMPVVGTRQDALAFRWLVEAARKRKGKAMIDRLASEMMDVMEGVGGAMKKKEDTHRMAEANKAFAHFARFRR
ncbi:MAG: 30S ribosomal protein S7 [Candidatus Magasanikbacteria bacterium]|nr:30S ribosomal protein S7 [Candidatus Magasanikbacteria bacterium]